MKTYIGIDVGAKGYIAVFKDGEWQYFPLLSSNPLDITDYLRQFAISECVCVIEDVRAIHGSGATATFNFGYGKGILIGILTALAIPYTQVAPKKWQKEMWDNTDKVNSGDKIDTKKTSINCAKRLFPHIDFRRTEKCKNVDDNKVDATLLCEYGRRLNL